VHYPPSILTRSSPISSPHASSFRAKTMPIANLRYANYFTHFPMSLVMPYPYPRYRSSILLPARIHSISSSLVRLNTRATIYRNQMQYSIESLSLQMLQPHRGSLLLRRPGHQRTCVTLLRESELRRLQPAQSFSRCHIPSPIASRKVLQNSTDPPHLLRLDTLLNVSK
jgi:hypothetical protein